MLHPIFKIPALLLCAYYGSYTRRLLHFFGISLQRRTQGLISLALYPLFLLILPLYQKLFILLGLHIMLLSGFFWLLQLPFRRYRYIRRAYECRLIPLFLALFAVIFGYFHIQNVQATYYTIETESVQMRIVFVSDLHYPNAMTPERLQEYCDEISQSKPDLVLFGGDIVDEGTSIGETKECISILNSIKSEHGSFFIYGNHDNLFLEDGNSVLLEALENSDITPLADKYVQIEDLTLIGRKDRSDPNRADLADLIPEDSAFVLVLDHQPLEAEQTAANGCDLMLSGHTHNGQIWPIGYINALLGPKYGHYTFGAMDLIVSSGIVGWGFPVRTQGVSEYVILDLVSP